MDDEWYDSDDSFIDDSEDMFVTAVAPRALAAMSALSSTANAGGEVGDAVIDRSEEFFVFEGDGLDEYLLRRRTKTYRLSSLGCVLSLNQSKTAREPSAQGNPRQSRQHRHRPLERARRKQERANEKTTILIRQRRLRPRATRNKRSSHKLRSRVSPWIRLLAFLFPLLLPRNVNDSLKKLPLWNTRNW